MSIPRPRKPTLLLFDLGGVLIRLRAWRELLPPDALALLESSAGKGAGFGPPDIQQRFERGLVSESEYLDSVRRRFAAPWSDDEIRAVYTRRLGEPVPGMEDVVKEARDRGLRVAGLSNTDPIHVPALLAYPAVKLLERLVTSCGIGVLKPDREAYDAAARLLGVPSAEVFFVDDLEENVAGAAAAGMSSVRFESAAALRRSLGW